MIEYTPDRWGIWFAFSLRGSIFPKSFGFAIACSAVTVCGHLLLSWFDMKEQVELGDKGTSMLSMFTFVLGFLIVFRTQQAYSRWWEGGTLLQELRGDWFNAYSCLVAFANPAASKQHDVKKFQHHLARLFSLLHGSGLAQVSSLDHDVKQFEVIDLEDLDLEALRFLDGAHDACEITLQWIQRLIGDAHTKETIKVAPPILSRVYNQLGSGVVKLNNARKIKHFPIPFPFAQMITVMLLIHWVMASFICATSIESPVWAGLLAFTVIISFWSINFIALELEDPFGGDANDLPIHDMQISLNRSLMELLKPGSMKAPDFNFNEAYHSQVRRYDTNFVCMHKAVSKVLNDRPRDAFKLAEASPGVHGTPSSPLKPVKNSFDRRNSAPAPSATLPVSAPCPLPVPAPKAQSVVVAGEAATPIVFAPSLRGTVQGGADLSLSGGAGLRSAGAGQRIDAPSSTGPAKQFIFDSIEKGSEHCNKIELQLGRVVSELENIADRQTVMYELHCDFWGLLSVDFQKTPAMPAQVRPFYQVPPFQPDVSQAPATVSPLKPIPLSVPLQPVHSRWSTACNPDGQARNGTGGYIPEGPSNLC